MNRVHPLLHVDTTTTEEDEESRNTPPGLEKGIVHSPSTYNLSTTTVISTLLQIVLIPAFLTAASISLPSQPPIPGIKNNWVFCLLATPLGSILFLMMYSWWGEAFTGHLVYSPIAASSISVTILVTLFAQFSPQYPLQATGIICAVVFAIAYNISFRISGKMLKIDTPEFLVALQRFSRFRILYAIYYVSSMAYMITFSLSTSQVLQLLLPALFSLYTWGFKVLLLYYTRRFIPDEEQKCVVTFWIEFFYEMFGSLTLPSVKNRDTFAVMLILKVITSASPLLMLTKHWWKFRVWIEGLIEFTDFSHKEVSSKQGNLGSPVMPTENNLMNPETPREISLLQRTKNLLFIMIFSALEKEKLYKFTLKNYFYSASCHLLVPIYYIPTAWYMRYSYNKQYFPYVTYSQDSYYTAMVYSAISFGVSLISMYVVYCISRWKYDIDILRLTLPTVVKEKRYFIYSILSGIAMPFILLMYHFRVYWLFTEYNWNVQ
eukprot:TRINITY_DN4952_c0_g1_i1.p1 TRINITY_DN4952_c0_g1~~TRINITY_DN4952_c0_g1_i1.p1  ORF type:complete len:490 (-),score=43.48 TRINITY_DN4952_c0_g1_i1:252-1721(-)